MNSRLYGRGPIPPCSQVGRLDLDVGRPEQVAGELLKHEADAPGEQQGVERASVEVPDRGPLQDQSHQSRDQERHRQGDEHGLRPVRSCSR